MSLRQKQINEILGYHDNINRDVFEREKKHVYYSGLQEARPRERDLVVEAELKQRVTAIQYDIQNITQSIHYTPSATLVSAIGMAYGEEEGEPQRYKPEVEQSNLARQKSGKDNFDRMFSFLTKLIRDWNNLVDYYLIKTQQNRYSDAQESALKDSLTSLVEPLKDLLQKVVLLKPVTHDYYKIYNPISVLLRIVESGDLSKLSPNIIDEKEERKDPIGDLRNDLVKNVDDYEKKFYIEKDKFDALKEEIEQPHTEEEYRRLLQEKAAAKGLKQYYRGEYEKEIAKLKELPKRKEKEIYGYSKDTKSLIQNKIEDYRIRIKDVEMMIPSSKTEKAAIERLIHWYRSERDKLKKILSSETLLHKARDVETEEGFIDEDVPLSEIFKRDIKKRVTGEPRDRQLQQILSKLSPKNRSIAGESKAEEPYGRSEYGRSREAPETVRRFGPYPPKPRSVSPVERRPRDKWQTQFIDEVTKLGKRNGLSTSQKDRYGTRIMSREKLGFLTEEEADELIKIVEAAPTREEGEGKPSRKKGGAGPLGEFPDEATLTPYITKHLKPSRFKNTKIEVLESSSESESESEYSSSEEEQPVARTGGRKKRCKGSAKPVILNSPDKDLWFL